jgi:radical SAM protein with 4Fe4S-binding SPASM domain
MSLAAPPGNLERIADLQRRLRRHAVPVSGSIEPTRRCNLRCRHCYLGDERSSPARPELDTPAWLRLIDEAAGAGLIDLVITGGEPLLRPDFARLYTHAKDCGLRVVVFTNATLIDERVAGLLRDLPPLAVEASIYGATEATHELVTGVPGSFRRCREGLERLAAAGVGLALKTVLMTLNLHEAAGMERIAAGLGARWRFDAAIFPRLDGDRAPLALRVPPAAAAALDIADAEHARRWRACYDAGRALPATTQLYSCGAGVTGFHIDPAGTLLPCLMSRRPAAALTETGFAAGWRAIVAGVAALHAHPGYRCSACEMRAICGLCPPFFELEGGALEHPSPYLCELGDRRRQRMYTFQP